ncbi:hypothetical protein COX84_02005, partial [Candidatus Micrarchaeota archaeon CG_4_10_14_0_2_um_filter_49_7]
KGLAIRSNVTQPVNVTVNYSASELQVGVLEPNLRLYRCMNWTYNSKSCAVYGDWRSVVGSSVNVSANFVLGESSSLIEGSEPGVAYVVAETIPTAVPVLSLSVPSAVSIGHNSTSSVTFTVENSGTVSASNTGITCSSASREVCTDFTLMFNTTNLGAIEAGGSASVYANVSVPLGYASGTYSGGITISATSADPVTGYLVVVVPVNGSYGLSPVTFNRTLGLGTGEIGVVAVRNNGNIEQIFNITTNESGKIYTNASTVTVSKQGGVNVLVIYNVSSLTNTSALLWFNSSIGSGQNVSIYIETANFSVVMLGGPSVGSPVSGVTGGDTQVLNLTAALGGISLTENVSWSMMIGGSNCNSLSSTYSSARSRWELSCTLPSLSSINNTLQITGNYSAMNLTSGVREVDAFIYLDTEPPSLAFNVSTLNVNSSVNISIAYTDNGGVGTIHANMTLPDGSVSNLSLVQAAGTDNWSAIFNDTQNYGNYLLSVWANDTSGNNASGQQYIGVYTVAYFSVNLTNAGGSAVNATFEILTLSNDSVQSFNASGWFNRSVSTTGQVNLEITVPGMSTLFFENTSITNMSDAFRFDSFAGYYSGVGALKGFALNNISLNYSQAFVTINFSDTTPLGIDNVQLFKCSNYSYGNRTCMGGWSALENVTIDRVSRLATGTVSSFSAYLVAEFITGDGVCDSAHGESNAYSPNDCLSANGTTGLTTNYYTTSGGGGGGGTAGLRSQIDELTKQISDMQSQQGKGATSEEINRLKEINERLEAKMVSLEKKLETLAAPPNATDMLETNTRNIYFELYNKESIPSDLLIKNPLNSTQLVSVYATGSVAPFVELNQTELQLAGGQDLRINPVLKVGANISQGLYSGAIVFESEFGKVEIPVNLRVLQAKEDIAISLQLFSSLISPGDVLKGQIGLFNIGETKRLDGVLKIDVFDPSTEEVVAQSLERPIGVEGSTVRVEDVPIPSEIKEGNYVVRATYAYTTLSGRRKEASSVTDVAVRRNVLPMLLFFLAATGLVTAFYVYAQTQRTKLRRYLGKVDFTKLPAFGETSAFVGKIAETDVRAFLPLDKLTMHTLVAGATGSGKTVAAQVAVEEALKKGVTVLVFDPTAQWTGFLRKNAIEDMFRHYRRFGLEKNEARAFDGNIYLIDDKDKFTIDVKKFQKPGEVHIFVLNRLKPQDIEVVVSKVIESVFSSGVEEYRSLRMLIVFDEVHRLLPKFGGTGAGFKQIERAVREFRKWGIGLMLVSQVLSDFVGEIKANIGTEIQFRSKYENDLERIRLKFGSEALVGVVKSGVGTGLLHNSEYNNGNPYFVEFRPLLHNVVRLSDKELDIYKKYNDRIILLDQRIDEMKAKGRDVFDLTLELNLARDKMKKGAFNIVDIYLESLEAKIKPNGNGNGNGKKQ